MNLLHDIQARNPAGNGTDVIAKLISADASASRRTILRSLPVTELGLKPVPLTARRNAPKQSG